MYADDTVICVDNWDELKHAITSLEKYCNNWKFEVNCDKKKGFYIWKVERLILEAMILDLIAIDSLEFY